MFQQSQDVVWSINHPVTCGNKRLYTLVTSSTWLIGNIVLIFYFIDFFYCLGFILKEFFIRKNIFFYKEKVFCIVYKGILNLIEKNKRK